MKRILMSLLLYAACGNMVFSGGITLSSWEGEWNYRDEAGINLSPKLPFHSELLNDIIIIYNDSPSRLIHCKIMDENGAILEDFDVNEGNSSRIIFSVSDFPEGKVYRIVLTDINPSNIAYSTFKK